MHKLYDLTIRIAVYEKDGRKFGQLFTVLPDRRHTPHTNETAPRATVAEAVASIREHLIDHEIELLEV